MTLGIVLHVALAYLGGWPFVDPYGTWDGLGLLTDAIHLFRMPAFFLLSGFFGALLWARRGAKAMLRNRFERLVLPFVVFLTLLWPAWKFVEGFAESLLNGVEAPIWHGFGVAWFTRFTPTDTMHLWFLYDLILIIAISAVAVRVMTHFDISWPRLQRFVRNSVERPWRCLVVFGLLNFVWCWPLKWTGIPTSGSWEPDPAIVFYYLVCYTLGWILYAAETPLSCFQDRAWSLLFVGLGCIGLRAMAFPELEGFEEVAEELPPANILFWYSVVVAASSLGLVALTRSLMGLFLRYAGGGSTRWRYISDSSYWVYLLHLPLSVLIPALMMDWDLPVLIKFPVAVAAVSAVCWLTYDFAVRPTVVGRFLNGRRYPAAAWRLSALGTVLAVGWMSYGVVYPPDPPPPWRNGEDPLALLPDEAAIYPYPTEGLDCPPDSKCASLGSEQLEECLGLSTLRSSLRVRRYVLCPTRVDFDTMSDVCARWGAAPLELKTEQENTELAELVQVLTDRPFWLTVTDAEEEGEWLWPDGLKLTFQPWADGEPNDWGGGEDCAALNWHGSGGWNDVGCDAELGLVCELTGRPGGR